MPEPILISRTNVVDVDRGAISCDENVEFEGVRISSVSGARPRFHINDIDGSGYYLCPGLIDAHVHMFLNAGARPLETFLRASDEEKLCTAAANLDALRSGITTVRDGGGPAELVFRVQKGVQRGDVAGPRVLAAGAPIARPKGHCHFFGIEASKANEVERAVESQASRGATFVNLIASGGGLTPGTRPEQADLPSELMHAAVRAVRVRV